MKKLLFFALLVFLTAVSPVLAGKYSIDGAHSEIGFSVKHMVITNVKGSFRDYTAGFDIDENNQLTSVKADISAASINTHVEKRDDHLRSADFFEVAQYPKITFASTSVTPVAEGVYKVTGLLNIKATEKEITLAGEISGPVNDPWGNQRMGIVLTGKIDRRDFDVVYNQVLETGGLLIDNDVKIHLEGEGILQK